MAPTTTEIQAFASTWNSDALPTTTIVIDCYRSVQGVFIFGFHDRGEGVMMSIRQIVGIGVVAFLLPFFWHTGRQWWEWIRSPEAEKEATCEYNLKSLWLLSRRVSHHYKFPFPPPFKAVKAYVDKRPSILMTRQIAEYLGFGHVAERMEGAYWTFDAILVCAKDPKHLLKMAKMAQGLGYEPSYLWNPDARTLAYCPHCRLAVLMDGKLERR